MFELGKKNGSNKHVDDHSSQKSRQESDASATESTGLSSQTGRRQAAVIGRSIRINGDLQGEEDLRIEGDIKGTIQLKNNTLTIGSEGKVRADVYAKAVTVDGLMEGDLYVTEQVRIRKSAQVNGNITAPRVSLEDGAKFRGSMEMDPKAVKSALGDDCKPAASASKPTPISASRSSSDELIEATETTSPGRSAKS